MGPNNAPFVNDILTIWGYKFGVKEVFLCHTSLY